LTNINTTALKTALIEHLYKEQNLRTTVTPKTVAKNYRFTEERSKNMRSCVARLKALGINMTETELVEQGIDHMLAKLAKRVGTNDYKNKTAKAGTQTSR
jgi:hypothetical protein